MRRIAWLGVGLMLAASLSTTGCQRMVDVQTGTRVVDGSGKIISEDIKTVSVPAEKAGSYRVVTITRTDSGVPQAAALYAEVQAALTAGNTQLAEKKLAELLTIQPNYPNAKQQHDALLSGKKVKPDVKGPPSSGSTAKQGAQSEGVDATAGGLAKWVPNTLAGYHAAAAAIDPIAVSREYAPSSSDSAVRAITLQAEQFRSSGDAAAALKTEVKNRYSRDSVVLQVGAHSAYFGTDGRGFAVLGFVDGAVMVAIEGAARSGSPSELRSLLLGVAKQLP